MKEVADLMFECARMLASLVHFALTCIGFLTVAGWIVRSTAKRGATRRRRVSL
jgi:hypothetical protein